jgi:hypothetical protein
MVTIPGSLDGSYPPHFTIPSYSPFCPPQTVITGMAWGMTRQRIVQFQWLSISSIPADEEESNNNSIGLWVPQKVWHACFLAKHLPEGVGVFTTLPCNGNTSLQWPFCITTSFLLKNSEHSKWNLLFVSIPLALIFFMGLRFELRASC